MNNRMASPNYINPSKLEHVKKKQSESAKIRWSIDDGTHKKLVCSAMNSETAKSKKIFTRNKKSPIYHMVNVVSGIEVKMTRIDFIKKIFDGKLTNFNDIIPNKKTGKSRRNIIKGWKLIQILNNPYVNTLYIVT